MVIIDTLMCMHLVNVLAVSDFNKPAYCIYFWVPMNAQLLHSVSLLYLLMFGLFICFYSYSRPLIYA